MLVRRSNLQNRSIPVDGLSRLIWLLFVKPHEARWGSKLVRCNTLTVVGHWAGMPKRQLIYPRLTVYRTRNFGPKWSTTYRVISFTEIQTQSVTIAKLSVVGASRVQSGDKHLKLRQNCHFVQVLFTTGCESVQLVGLRASGRPETD